jgi:hypothetical protein
MTVFNALQPPLVISVGSDCECSGSTLLKRLLLTLYLYISASSHTACQGPFLACAPALGIPCSKLFRQCVVHRQRSLKMSFQTRQDFFRTSSLFFWIFTFFYTTAFLARGQVPAVAFLAANIAWVITLEITVRSKRSGKFLFKAYMLVIISFNLRSDGSDI